MVSHLLIAAPAFKLIIYPSCFRAYDLLFCFSEKVLLKAPALEAKHIVAKRDNQTILLLSELAFINK